MATPSFKDKVVLITGAASGIGRATAIYFSGLGARLAITDVNEEGLNETASLTDSACQLITAQLDVSDAERCKAVCKETAEYFAYMRHQEHTNNTSNFTTAPASANGANGLDQARIDHVLACAGINPTEYPTTALPEGYFEKLISVNLLGVHNVATAAVPYLKKPSAALHISPNSPSIVTISSSAGVYPRPGVAPYSATKAAVLTYSKSLAVELGRSHGIRVNCVTPGNTDTPSNASVVAGPAAVEESMKRNALGRLGKPEEVAGVIAYLMEGDGSPYVNGAVWNIDGGLVV